MNANDYEKGVIYEDEYLNCLTFIVDEISSNDVMNNDQSGLGKEKLFITKKAYCFMFRNHHYLLIFELLTTILKLMKHEMTKKIDTKSIGLSKSEILPEYEDLLENIKAHVNLPIYTNDIKLLLDL